MADIATAQLLYSVPPGSVATTAPKSVRRRWE
jgi:hypothetical protein